LGKHRRKKMKVRSIAVALAAVVGIIAVPVQGSAATQVAGKVAYISKGGGSAFETYFENRSFRFENVSMAEAATFDFSGKTLIVIADSTDSNAWDGWGSPEAVENIQESGKPVLALGQGGSIFLDSAGTSIGWMNASYVTSDSVKFVGAAGRGLVRDLPVQSDENGNSKMYTSDTTVVTVYAPLMDSETKGLALEAGSSEYYGVAQEVNETGSYMLWGFRQSPSKMNAGGKAVFLRAVKRIQ
jgi:hypothetical protein